MNHENIIKVFDLMEFKNFLLMPMEIGKFSLMQLIKQRFRNKKGFNEEEVAQIMKGVLEGLNHMHSTRKILHRDLKPDNVLMISKTDFSKLKIIDFGMATEIDDIQDFVSCGTWTYQPPE